MASRSRTFNWPSLALAPATVMVMLAPGPAGAVPVAETPVRVDASFKISFGVLGKVGTIQSVSERNGQAFKLTAHTRIKSALFNYTGDLTSTGTLAGRGPQPDSFVFDTSQKSLLGKKKRSTVKVGFKNGAVASRSFEPRYEPSPENIPVKDAQLKGVLDPLTAVMALSMADPAKPCVKKLAVFDGKQRFDISLSETGRVKLPGGSETGYVCRVSYTPVSGHKPGKGSGLTSIDKIEVVLRPVARANIIVAHQINVSTKAGDIVLTSEWASIKMPNQTEIALRR